MPEQAPQRAVYVCEQCGNRLAATQVERRVMGENDAFVVIPPAGVMCTCTASPDAAPELGFEMKRVIEDDRYAPAVQGVRSQIR